MRAKQFFYICAGLLMLAVAYHLGASSVEAQMPSPQFVGIAEDSRHVGGYVALTSNGDLYGFMGSMGCDGSGPRLDNDPGNCSGFTGWAFMENILSGGPISVEKATVGDMKAKYKDEADE